MKLVLVCLVAGVCFAQTPASVQSNDWTIVPGVRVGPLTAAAVRADMAKLFPQASVKDDELELEEGMVFPATWVSREKQSESLAIVWTGKDAGAHPKQVFPCRGFRPVACKWQVQAAGGRIGSGTKLTALEALNSKPFTIHGFGFGYGGNVESWDGGKLDQADCNHTVAVAIDGERRQGDFTIALTDEDINSFSGNKSVPTTTPALRKLDPAVTSILFTFPAAGAKACSQ